MLGPMDCSPISKKLMFYLKFLLRNLVTHAGGVDAKSMGIPVSLLSG